MREKTNILARLDWQLLGIYFVLVILGWLNIYAAVFNEEHRSIFDISQKYGKQLLWIGASVVLIITLFMINRKTYVYFPYPIYISVIILLVVVLAFGREVNGAKSWLELGAIRLQPAEFAKLGTALLLAKIMSVYNFELLKWKNLLIVGAVMLIPASLILLQNDTGSALVYASFILVLYREGLPSWILVAGLLLVTFFILALLWGLEYVTLSILLLAFIYAWFKLKDAKTTGKAFAVVSFLYATSYFLDYYFNINLTLKLLLPIVVASLIFAFYAFRHNLKYIYFVLMFVLSSFVFVMSVDYVFNNVLGQHQRDRINNLLGIEFDPLGAGYNVNQSLIAIGSGGFSGKGFLQGTQTKYDFVPEQSTDFIFCTVGEEWGFLGTMTILLLFLWLLIRIIIIAERQKSAFTRIYAYGVASIFFFHIAVNVGMTIGLAPVIGIPLPFFSYGGSSLWSFTILLFILLRLDADSDKVLN